MVTIEYLKKDCSALSTLLFALMLSVDIYNYKLQTKTVIKGYFTEVEKVFFLFSWKLTQLKRVMLKITIIYSQMKGCDTTTFSVHARQGAFEIHACSSTRG